MRIMGIDPASGEDYTVYVCKPKDLTPLIKRIDVAMAKWRGKRKQFVAMNKMSSLQAQQAYYLSLQDKPSTAPGDDLQ